MVRYTITWPSAFWPAGGRCWAVGSVVWPNIALLVVINPGFSSHSKNDRNILLSNFYANRSFFTDEMADLIEGRVLRFPF